MTRLAPTPRKSPRDGALRDAWSAQALRFAVSGLVGTGTHYLVMAALIMAVALAPVIATVIGAACGTLVNYVAHRRFTFDSQTAHRHTVPRYVGATLIGWGLNGAIFAAMHDGAGTPIWIAQLVGTAIVLVVNFWLARQWVFQERR
jgi:putative flippase GtrA